MFAYEVYYQKTSFQKIFFSFYCLQQTFNTTIKDTNLKSLQASCDM